MTTIKRTEDFKKAIGNNKFVFMGDVRHGLAAVGMLIFLGDKIPPGNVYIESIYHTDTERYIDPVKVKGLKPEDINKAKADSNSIEQLEKIGHRVIGLEDQITAPALALEKMKVFEQDDRCTVSNPNWAELIVKTSQVNVVSYVCCGPAHLISTVEENKRMVPSLGEEFYRLLPPPRMDIFKPVNFYVAASGVPFTKHKDLGITIIRQVDEDYESSEGEDD